ncbi:MAG TPA: tRNA (N6-isopentenyl adenosine(37)-C2)-methylthiotransferase MiaB [Bacteroidota bacterium]|nr:tRNA (N6-isopentenyl adenosine(37)-C2)-methylthiotransferase MiaB [Bacteroidota bacterium]
MRRVYIETYGCQMNLADSEVVGGILSKEGYAFTSELSEADVILVNTCAIRDNAEQRIHGRLGLFSSYKRRKPSTVVGILGCMAERLRTKLVEEEQVVDLVVGPDEYRKLPLLIENAFVGEKGVATRLSRVENYEDIVPLRTDGVCAWISVMRGCDKFCSFCVVPFTRGRERSRSLASVVEEVRGLVSRGFREVTLLGQNVNSYRDGDHDFADLLHHVAAVDPLLRVRFTTSHPQDMSDKLIETIATHDNICKYIHLPVQSGSDRILRLMNRSYTVEHYVKLVERIRAAMPGVSLSTDIISGFPTETEEDHRMTMDLVREIRYDGAYTFKYSPRENTKAWEMNDDVPEHVKGERVFQISELQRTISLELNRRMIGTVERILVEGPSKKSDTEWMGRTDTNKTVIFPKVDERPGEYIDVVIERCTSATLFGRRVAADAALDVRHQAEVAA